MDIKGIGVVDGSQTMQQRIMSGASGNNPFKNAIESMEKMKTVYAVEISKIKEDKSLDKKTADLRIEVLEKKIQEIEAEIAKLRMEEAQQKQEDIKSKRKEEQISNSEAVDKTAEEQTATMEFLTRNDLAIKRSNSLVRTQLSMEMQMSHATTGMENDAARGAGPREGDYNSSHVKQLQQGIATIGSEVGSSIRGMNSSMMNYRDKIKAIDESKDVKDTADEETDGGETEVRKMNENEHKRQSAISVYGAFKKDKINDIERTDLDRQG